MKHDLRDSVTLRPTVSAAAGRPMLAGTFGLWKNREELALGMCLRLSAKGARVHVGRRLSIGSRRRGGIKRSSSFEGPLSD